MGDRQGWWAFHRKMWDNGIFYGDGIALAIWCWMLSEAAWQEGRSVRFQGQQTYLKAGQFTAGRKQIAKAVGCTENKVRYILILLNRNQQIHQQADNKKTLFSVVNWAKYQDEPPRDSPTNNQPTTTTEQRNKETNYLPPPTGGGSVDKITPRQSGTDPRTKGTNPRATKTNPRALRDIAAERFHEERGYWPAS